MREIRPSGSEGGGLEFNRFSLPLSSRGASGRSPKGRGVAAATPARRAPEVPTTTAAVPHLRPNPRVTHSPILSIDSFG